MDLDDLKRVNRLWAGIYPYLAEQISESYQKDFGTVLELGPFSGGISVALARLHPKLNITIADESPEVLEYLRDEISTAGLSGNIIVRTGKMRQMSFDDAQFDLIILRGAFFFLDQKGVILREIFRVLKAGGVAFVGGGFGKGTPKAFIDEIADESRVLNDRLGRRRVSILELEKMLRASGLADKYTIEEAGGVWLNIRK